MYYGNSFRFQLRYSLRVLANDVTLPPQKKKKKKLLSIAVLWVNVGLGRHRTGGQIFLSCFLKSKLHWTVALWPPKEGAHYFTLSILFFKRLKLVLRCKQIDRKIRKSSKKNNTILKIFDFFEKKIAQARHSCRNTSPQVTMKKIYFAILNDWTDW